MHCSKLFAIEVCVRFRCNAGARDATEGIKRALFVGQGIEGVGEVGSEPKDVCLTGEAPRCARQS